MRFIVFALLAIAVVYGQEEKKICEPGIVFKDACNQCTCSKDGTAKACTLMLCLDTMDVATNDEKSEDVTQSQISTEAPRLVTDSPLLRRRRQVNLDKPCDAGKKFKLYCNMCTCGSDGNSVSCTKMQCPEGFYNEDGTLTTLGKAKIELVA